MSDRNTHNLDGLKHHALEIRRKVVRIVAANVVSGVLAGGLVLIFRIAAAKTGPNRFHQ